MTAETDSNPLRSVVADVPDGSPLEVLVVDADAAAGPAVRRALGGEASARVRQAADSRQALRLLGTQPWDLVIIDPSLPESCETLAARASHCGTAVLVVLAPGPPTRPILPALALARAAQARRLGRQKRVLAIGAHPDDVEIGCGGTLARHGAEGDRLHILTLSRGAAGGDVNVRTAEAHRAATILGAGLTFGNLPDTRIGDGCGTIEVIRAAIDEVRPTHVYTHCAEDTHQDHRAAHAASLVAARAVANVYCYEASSATQAFEPNHFIDIADYMERKLAAADAYGSQRRRVPALHAELLRARALYWGHMGGGARLVEPMRVIHQRAAGQALDDPGHPTE